ncbi:MAG: ABC transporter ATP-binding protein [Ruminococcaceae bacterium]|nr:ABC transporter ATP-binding protein [Oscillospiraceae bacterium]
MIKIQNLSKSFGDKAILKNFSYDFKKTGVVCIKGASGCGKTTLLRIISGLEKADSGNILINGKLSYMFQEDRLLSFLTAIENVTCVMDGKASEKKEKAEKLLSAVGLSGDINTPVTELSGGMKRRVAFARALAFEPDILLLDEPFNGLDPETRQLILKIVSDISKERLVILVTHDNKDIKALSGEVLSLS